MNEQTKWGFLPVYQYRQQILDTLKENQALIVASPPGSGKTTQLPLFLHEAGYSQKGWIGVTQPRRIATISVSDFIARQLQTEVGGTVGYKMRFYEETSPETKIKIMTDGTLLQEIKNDPLLSRYSVIMVDEVHERSLTIDFILGLLKNVLKARSDFKLLLSSATIHAESFSDYLEGCPIISIQTKTYPVQLIYRPIAPSENQPNRAPRQSASDLLVSEIVEILKSLDPDEGDVLVFLPGEATIKNCMKEISALRRSYQLYPIPLYSRLNQEEQQRVFEDPPPSRNPGRLRKVILATNIAETSITIDGITAVIDTGLAKINFYNSLTLHSELREGKISKASAEQRRGRAGRTAPGVCYRLYPRKDFQLMSDYTLEEIYRTDLTEVVLRMAEIGIREFESFDFLSRPNQREVSSAVENLIQLGALERKTRTLTPIGQLMCYFPLLPKHSRILVEAMKIDESVVHYCTVITTFLSSNSPFSLPYGEEAEARRQHQGFMSEYGDFDMYIQMYQRFVSVKNKMEFCERHYLDYDVMREMNHVVIQLKSIIENLGISISQTSFPYPVRKQDQTNYLRACLTGLFPNLCVSKAAKGGARNRNAKVIYQTLTSNKICIHPGSSLFYDPPPLILAGEIIRTSQLYARSASVVPDGWLRREAPELYQKLHCSREELGRGREKRSRDKKKRRSARN